MKKGIFFTLDAIFASFLIVLAIVLATKYFILETDNNQINYYSNDIIICLSNIKVNEINDSYVKYLIDNGLINNLDNSVIDQIGEFYVLNMTEYARNLSLIAVEKLIPKKFGIEILINNESIFYNQSLQGKKEELSSSRRLISGIEKFKPLRGATSKVFLSGITRKKYSSYVYFGGFIGQGNITAKKYLADNINLSNIYMELNTESDFYLYVNGYKCLDTFYPSLIYMTADTWNITECSDFFVKGGNNNLSIIFLDTLDKAYIGGGFIRFDYYTSEMAESSDIFKMEQNIHGVKGIVNVYDSFYVPGNIKNISVYLHYFAEVFNGTNNTFYFTIGNSTLYRDSNLTGEKSINLSYQNITSKISEGFLSLKTIPFRIGFENASFGYIYEGNADVALITDVSGSMAWQMINNDNGVNRSCDDPNINNSDSTRLSVARCVDKEFVNDILNITGNKVGLISYSTNTITSQTIEPTINATLLNSVINSYSANGYTCICCGINSARMLLANKTRVTMLINRQSNWLYNNFSLLSDPELDSNNNSWYFYSYNNETEWHNGNAILGATNGFFYLPYVNKEIGSNLSYNSYFANLWEHNSDVFGPPNDFSSGILNYTGNTYGINGNDDGWDWDTNNGTGPFGNDDDIDYNFIVNGMLEFDSGTGNPIRNRCSNNDCSGAYGIKINVTQQMYNNLLNGGSAILSFYYEWHEENSNPFESDDEVWIKARWTSPFSGQIYLGGNYDYNGLSNQHSGSDNTYEIAAGENPDVDIFGNYMQDISSYIEGPGYYYLELGGKLLANANDEYGFWRFDNIQLEFTNSTNYYYFRKNFTISDLNLVKKGVLNVLADDYAEIYLNGELIDIGTKNIGKYWNRIGITIPQERFLLGTNVIAAKLVNSNASAKFDLELIGLNESRDFAMLVMTDGQANYYCSDYNDTTGSSDTVRAISAAINASCYARERYGITVYAVGFSDEADEDTLREIAECGQGIYATSNNITRLREFYKDVASSIVSASRHAQTIEIRGNLTSSILYPDSYIKIEYLPIAEQPKFGEISRIVEEKNFDNCSFKINIPNDVRVSDAKITSYSSEHWTDGLIVNNISVYNLSVFAYDYTGLGDPFLVNIPTTTLLNGENTFEIRTGDHPENSTGCSLNNTLIYTANVLASASYNDVLEKAIGCSWFIEFDDGDNITIDVPPIYSGEKKCNYTNAQITSEIIGYDTNDTYDDAMFKLLSNLDFDNDGRIYINIKENNLVVGAISVGKVPYPWGPAIAEIRVWR